ncbi:hypothetical protein GEOBRER4_n1172 [Citrifermentans bremense]|uniref:Uncharacterized protein n=1 Tax=Citrifermentans bremense TaxID=60035 RepID=A0A7R7IZ49_9BACT|nr:hypothetical protein GEOBRER4_n1172 [Citrifermentans bremense]
MPSRAVWSGSRIKLVKLGEWLEARSFSHFFVQGSMLLRLAN